MRWSFLTPKNYNKYAFIFGKQLPFTFRLSSFSQQTYVRDAIQYASIHELKGKDWYGKVKVTNTDMKDPCSVTIDWKDGVIPVEAIETSASLSVFDFMNMVEEGKELKGEYKVLEGVDVLKPIAKQLNIEYTELDNGNIMFT